MKCTCRIGTDDENFRFSHMAFCPMFIKLPQTTGMREEAKENLAGGKATSSKIPPFKYIPLWAVEALAAVFQEGVESHKEKSWNALAPSFHEVNADKGWVIERLSHVIHHSLKALMEVSGQCQPTGENHAGAILFGGSVLACHLRGRKEIGKELSTAAGRPPVSIVVKGPGPGEALHRIFIGSVQVTTRGSAQDAEEIASLLEQEINGR